METLLEWVGTLALLALLLVIVPIFFMLIVTLQFRLIENTRRRDTDVFPRTGHQPPDSPHP